MHRVYLQFDVENVVDAHALAADIYNDAEGFGVNVPVHNIDVFVSEVEENQTEGQVEENANWSDHSDIKADKPDTLNLIINLLPDDARKVAQSVVTELRKGGRAL